MNKKFWKGIIVALIIVLPFWVWVGSKAFGATYYMRAAGTAANKAAASGPCGTQANCMSIATHDADAYAAGDTIILCDDGGVYRDQMDIPSSGSDGSPITYEAASGDTPIISGADLIAPGTSWSLSAVYGADLMAGSGATGTFDADTTGWVVANGTFTSVADGQAGNCALLARTADNPYARNKFEPVAVTSGKTYNVTAYAKQKEEATIRCWIDDNYDFTNSGTYVYEEWEAPADWLTQKSWNWVATGNELHIKFQVRTVNGTDGTYIDTILVRERVVWEATCNIEPDIVLFDGVVGYKEDSTANLSAAEEWYWAANVLYVYSVSDPDTAYTTPGLETGAETDGITMNTRSYITIDGLTVQAANERNIEIEGAGTSNIIIKNCTIEKWGTRGVQFKSTIDGVGLEVYDCTFDGGVEDNSAETDDALFTQVPGIKIYRNTIHDATDGIVVGTNSTATYPEIYENTIYDLFDYPDGGDLPAAIDLVPTGTNLDGARVHHNIISACDKGINIDSAQNTYIYCNIIFGQNGNGWEYTSIHAYSAANTMYIYNNTIYQGGYGISIEANSPNATIKNNLCISGYRGIRVADDGSQTGLDEDHNNCYGNSDANYQDFTEGAHSLEVVAGFKDAGGGDFTLNPDSLCRNAGVYIPGYTTKLHWASVWPSAVVFIEGYLAIGAFEVPRGAAGM